MPSAKADSILSTLLSRHLRAGLSRWRRFAAGARFIPLAVIVTEFRNSFAAAAATGIRPRLTRKGRSLCRAPLLTFASVLHEIQKGLVYAGIVG